MKILVEENYTLDNELYTVIHMGGVYTPTLANQSEFAEHDSLKFPKVSNNQTLYSTASGIFESYDEAMQAIEVATKDQESRLAFAKSDYEIAIKKGYSPAAATRISSHVEKVDS